MLFFVKVFIVFIQRIISEMNISILIVLSTIILLSRKSNQTIIIDKDSHWRNYTCNENINSEVILMAI